MVQSRHSPSALPIITAMKRKHCLPLHHAQLSVVIDSICASCAVEALSLLFNSQKVKLLCSSFIEHDRVAGCWSFLFVLSKLPELGDTVFIVLRKQPLIFLHWYHHITVLLYSWFSYTEYTSSARWYIVMNYCVHSIMYSYYALRSMGYQPWKNIAMLITSCQLTQMIVGCAVNIWAAQYLQEGKQECHISWFNIKLSLAMYFSYFVLFARFFYKAYVSPNRGKGRAPVGDIPGKYTSSATKVKSQ